MCAASSDNAVDELASQEELVSQKELASQEELTSQKELASQEELASASVLSSPDLVGRIVDMGRHGTPFFGCDAPLIDVRSAGALRLVDSVWRAAVEERLRAAAAVEISCRLPPALSTPAANHVLLRFEHAAAPATVSRALASFEQSDGHDLASLAVRGLNLRRFMTSLLAVLKRRGGGGLCSLDLAGCLAVPTMVVGSRPAPACLFSQHRLVPALLGACPGLRALDLSGLHLPPEALQSLSRAPMSALRLHGCTLERGSVLTLLRPGSALAASLTFLDLGGCSLSASDAEEARGSACPHTCAAAQPRLRGGDRRSSWCSCAHSASPTRGCVRVPLGGASPASPASGSSISLRRSCFPPVAPPA